MNEYYEVHITMQGKKDVIEPAVLKLGWKYSAIDGDIVMGDGVKCYATMHYSTIHTKEWVKDELIKAALAMHDLGIEVLRQKIELVIYDTKQKAVEPK